MTAINETKFYNALESIFIGAKIEGDSGYINLLKIKSKYYNLVLTQFRQDIENECIITSDFKEEFFDILYSFFEKYFSESGSMYFVKTANWQRVYEQVYTDNRDVMLFWKTHMLYYVKSDILFQSMAIDVRDEATNTEHNFYFDVGSLKNKQNNEKKVLFFSPNERQVKEGKKVFVFDVSYSEGGKKTKIPEISKSLMIREEILEKAFNTFKKQSECDFFINKNANKFLTEQLDIYLHQILLEQDNQFDQIRLNQLKTIKIFAKKIIAFIAQFEDELVCIWNKPKFVLNSNYVITLDKLSAAIIKKIAVHLGLKEQIKEWEDLGIVEKGFDFKKIEENHKYLPIDTKYFKDLEIDLLASFDNLDEALDGHLIHSDNYQALNTLQERYKETIQCIYIDPPFNTGKDFKYIDGFQDSTWLSIIRDRLKLAHKFLLEKGSFYLHLDRYANYSGRFLLNDVFGKDNFVNEIIWRMGWVSGYKTQIDAYVRNHDTIFVYAKNPNKLLFNKALSNIPYKTYAYDDFREEISRVLKKVKLTEDNIRNLSVNIIEKSGNVSRIYPSNKNYKEGKYHIEDTWNCNPYEAIDSNKIKRNVAEYTPNGSEITQKPEELLKRIIKLSTSENDLIMDFFSGSGTTIATAHKLHRKWIGIEMGEYFKTDVLVRMKWVLDGKSVGISKDPDVNWQGGGFFKYYDLEQYENSLKNMKYADSTPSELWDNKNPFETYVFKADQKFADILNTTNNDIDIDFDKLYPNIDFAETISLIKGLPIRKITKTGVLLVDESKEIKTDYKNMTKDEKIAFVKLLKPLLWWSI
jgi:Adenine specific DNA methylase Mod